MQWNGLTATIAKCDGSHRPKCLQGTPSARDDWGTRYGARCDVSAGNRREKKMIAITEYQLRVCIQALKLAEVDEKNDSYFGSVLYDLLEKTGE